MRWQLDSVPPLSLVEPRLTMASFCVALECAMVLSPRWMPVEDYSRVIQPANGLPLSPCPIGQTAVCSCKQDEVYDMHVD